jgi:hypothetical protein
MESGPLELADERIPTAFDQQFGDAALQRPGFVSMRLIVVGRGRRQLTNVVKDSLGEGDRHLANASALILEEA